MTDDIDPLVKSSLQPAYHKLAEMDQLKATGVKLVVAICDSGTKLFPNHFAPDRTGASVRFTFFGIKLLARVELPLHEDGQPRFATYVVDETNPAALKSLEMDYHFDKLGNVNQHLTIEDAANRFIADVLRQLKANRVWLLP
jgi:hypothetical protein